MVVLKAVCVRHYYPGGRNPSRGILCLILNKSHNLGGSFLVNIRYLCMSLIYLYSFQCLHSIDEGQNPINYSDILSQGQDWQPDRNVAPKTLKKEKKQKVTEPFKPHLAGKE